MTQPLDDTDVALVRALQVDARRSNKELAAQVGLAPSSALVRHHACLALLHMKNKLHSSVR